MNDFVNGRHTVEVADVFRQAQHQLLSQHPLCPVQQKAFHDILRCRTMQAGGHINRCDNCGYETQAYNSCRNRHCPKCQVIKQEQWVDRLQGRLIPGRYFHVVFTIPQILNPLFYINQQQCYHLLFQAAWEALHKAGRNPNFLGADIGAVAVLHTWGQTLSYHPHIHLMVPAGGLSEDDTEWIPAPSKFFVPAKALSRMFRAILTRMLLSQISVNQLKLPEGFTGPDDLKEKLYQKRWNVNLKRARGGARGVLAYLGRYSHRVAISNSRLISLDDSKVTFSYRDYRKKGQILLMTLENTEFARRFLQHILPSGFCKIRYFGILATAHFYTRREVAISLLDETMWLPVLEGLSATEAFRIISGRDPVRCPRCLSGIMVPQAVAVLSG